ncbi:hypothetical protein CDD83_4335 [Cordyceps sp. RAO-2017]|nr:hypothetical protein CDD83_4335 [Cordyceps sp. RAO-2017]
MAGTQVQDQTKESLLPTACSTLPPDYQAASSGCVELTGLNPSASTSSETLPLYESGVGQQASSSSSSSPPSTTNLRATHAFQIEAEGHPLFALPLPPKPEPILVYGVLPTGEVGPLAFESLREKRSSGDCFLTPAGHPLPVCSTTYCFRPNRPPTIRLMGDIAREEDFTINGQGYHTRAQNMRTHLGDFQWRYASRAERKAAGASSLLVLDSVTKVAGIGGKRERRRRAVAHLVRNEQLRSQGTRGCTAGNGGRLLMDLTGLSDAKGEPQQMEVLIIASCICMLKKEVDRRRVHQFILMSGAASGGP